MSQSDFYRGVERATAALAAHGSAPPDRRAETVHLALAPLFAATPRAADRACRRGCAHCCHLPVGITFGEAALLAGALRQRPDVRHRFVAAASPLAGASWRDLIGRPCPLLADGACSLHDARPLPCRALAATDADGCARGLAGTGDVDLDAESFLLGLGAADALAHAETPAGTRELRSAVLALFDDDPAASFMVARRPDVGAADGSDRPGD